MRTCARKSHSDVIPLAEYGRGLCLGKPFGAPHTGSGAAFITRAVAGWSLGLARAWIHPEFLAGFARVDDAARLGLGF